MQIKIPELSLVVLVGASSSGKSTFAKKYFKPTEVISSDFCRALVSDDENSMEATNDAFDVLHYIVAKRLKRGKLTVIDATNVQPASRKSLLQLAKDYHCMAVVIVLNLPIRLLKERHENRQDRDFDKYVIEKQHRELKRHIRGLKKEGFRFIYEAKTLEEIENTSIERQPLWNNKKHETGNFDIIGDIHGCFDETKALLEKLDYQIKHLPEENIYSYQVTPPENKRVIFLGDLVDRGPKSPEVLRLVMSMVKDKVAFCVPGNHDVKLLKKLNGKNVQIKHGLAETLEQLEQENEEFIIEVKKFLKSLISHYVMDNGKLVVAHAGLREDMQGRGSAAVRSFALYGETTGEIDEFGLPVRYNWASEYKGKSMVVYGHTPIPQPEWLNNTINIDTGCVFGGKLTALRYPKKELVSVEAKKVYAEPVRPVISEEKQLSAQQEYDDLLDIEDVTGKRIVSTRFSRNITIKEENSIVALEVMSRFGINPKWLMYLPPTMSPTETSQLDNFLEYPHEAFDYYKNQGVAKVICEEKHMGSRAVVIVCKEEKVAQERFGLIQGSLGIVYTRTGRRFFKNLDLEQEFLKRVGQALNKSAFWEKLETDWLCLDCELMPWSAKAQDLIRNQYAAVGTSGHQALKASLENIKLAQERGLEIESLAQSYKTKFQNINAFTEAYRVYCREIEDLKGIQLAPFHILATEGETHTDKDHIWHMETIADFCKEDTELLLSTPYKVVDLNNVKDIQEATNWWGNLTKEGGEGMVVKPLDFIVKNSKGLVQPAIKCRGKEYLRIIYGAEYDKKEYLERLKKRGLGKKRSLALREFVLGLEALERFVAKEPLRKTHECAFGVLALESEEVDPRL